VAKLFSIRPDFDERSHLDRNPAGDDGFASPGQRFVHVGALEDPEAADVFLGFEVGPSVMETLPSGCLRSDLAWLADSRPPAKKRAPAASISSLSAPISRIIASPSSDGS